jgi:acetyltransferase
MGGLYPPEFECQAKLSDGCCIQIRPLNFDEYELLDDLYNRSTEESLRKRFGWTDAREWLRSIKGCIDTGNLCLVGEYLNKSGKCEIVGDCWYFIDKHSGNAEVSILVRDDFQNKTLGTKLMTQLVDIARVEGLYRLFALVNVSNTPMLRIIQRLKFNFVHGADGVNLYRLDL